MSQTSLKHFSPLGLSGGDIVPRPGLDTNVVFSNWTIEQTGIAGLGNTTIPAGVNLLIEDPASDAQLEINAQTGADDALITFASAGTDVGTVGYDDSTSLVRIGHGGPWSGNDMRIGASGEVGFSTNPILNQGITLDGARATSMMSLTQTHATAPVLVLSGSGTGNEITGDAWSVSSLGEFTGIIASATTGTTQAPNTNNTTLATTAYVDTAIGGNNEWSEILANGNTSGANDAIMTAGQTFQTDLLAPTTALGTLVFNEAGNDVNLRMEGIGDANVFFLDGGNNNIGIGTATPQGDAALEVRSDGEATPKGFMPPKITSAQAQGNFSVGANMNGLEAVITDFGTVGKKFQVVDTGASNFEWRSIETVTVAFGRNGNSDGVYLRYGGNATDVGTGWVSPYNGVIQEVTAIETGGNPTKDLIIERYNSAGALQGSTTLSLVGSQYSDDNEGVVFNAGDRLNVFVSATGVAASNVAITMNIHWRIPIIV